MRNDIFSTSGQTSGADIACDHDRKNACSTCRLASLCIPLSLKMDDIKKLESIVNRGKRLDKSSHVYRAKDPFESIYAVRLGCIKTYKLTEDGTEQITGFYLPGEIFGVDGLGSDEQTNSAVALEDSAVCEIPFERLDQLGAEIPSLRRHLFRILGTEIAEDQKLMQLLSKNTAEQRISALLMGLSRRYAERGLSATQFRLPMSRGEIGNYLGLTIETVSRVLSKLQKASILELDNKEVAIRDIEALSNLTDGA